MSLEETDRASAAVQKTPNRVSLNHIKSEIAQEAYFTAGQALDALNLPSDEQHKVLTICILTMKNGFMVIGKSAPADAANFNVDVGRKFAFEDAVRQVWPLEGYLLRDKLSRQTAPAA